MKSKNIGAMSSEQLAKGLAKFNLEQQQTAVLRILEGGKNPENPEMSSTVQKAVSEALSRFEAAGESLEFWELLMMKVENAFVTDDLEFLDRLYTFFPEEIAAIFVSKMDEIAKFGTVRFFRYLLLFWEQQNPTFKNWPLVPITPIQKAINAGRMDLLDDYFTNGNMFVESNYYERDRRKTVLRVLQFAAWTSKLDIVQMCLDRIKAIEAESVEVIAADEVVTDEFFQDTELIDESVTEKAVQVSVM